MGSSFNSIFALAALIEAVTAFFRFGLGMQAARDTASSISRFTFGMRIHHGMIGLVLLLCAAFLTDTAWKRRLAILGSALAFSDAVHHFVVLWAVTGSPEFDLFYPR
ncbi:MAG TPA: hypothetical protein PKM25_11760 [Candidatus Ozemobacteraceae bacterium]|nr:hypothetical protein [Candidatus Ozemobacteraceae bacterium]